MFSHSSNLKCTNKSAFNQSFVRQFSTYNNFVFARGKKVNRMVKKACHLKMYALALLFVFMVDENRKQSVSLFLQKNFEYQPAVFESNHNKKLNSSIFSSVCQAKQ